MFTTFCASFPNKHISFQDPGYALGQGVLFIADTNPRESCVSRNLEVGNTFLILTYPGELQSPWFSPNVWFDPGSSIKLLYSKISIISAM